MKIDRRFGLAGVLAAGLTLTFLVVWRIFLLTTMPRPLADIYLDDAGAGLALCPDGGTLAYIVDRGKDSFVELRRLDGTEVRRLPRTKAARSPFFSPDGRYLGFLDSGKWMRVSLDSYEVEAIADAGDAEDACFREDGSVLLGSSTGLFLISPEGRKKELLRTRAHSPVGIRGSEWIVFEVSDAEGASLEVLSLANGARRKLVPEATLPRLLPPYLLFLRNSAIWASRFDFAKAELASGPAIMVPDVAWFDVAANGTLAFRRTGGPRPALRIVLHWDEELKRLVPSN